MTTQPPMTPTPAAAVARHWVNWYTGRANTEWAERRRAEIASDLWEQQADALRFGRSSLRLQLSIIRRVLVGMGADLRWANEQRSRTGVTGVSGRRWRAAGALAIAAFYLWLVVDTLSDADQGTGGLLVSLTGAGLVVLGLALQHWASSAGATLLALGAAPAMLAWWAPAVPALAIVVVVSAIGTVANLTIGRGTTGRAVAAMAGAVLALASFGPVVLGWGYHWPLAGLASVVVLALTMRRRAAG